MRDLTSEGRRAMAKLPQDCRVRHSWRVDLRGLSTLTAVLERGAEVFRIRWTDAGWTRAVGRGPWEKWHA